MFTFGLPFSCGSYIGRRVRSGTAIAFLLATTAFTSGGLAFGQANSGEISGAITDQTGAALPSASVKVTNTETRLQRTVTSNETGLYNLPSIPPGNYSVVVTAQGFKTEERKNVELQVGQTARLDFAMQVGSIIDTIEVSGGAPVLGDGKRDYRHRD